MSEMNKVVQELGQAFEEFKATNDQRLEAIAKGQNVDALLETKLANINAAITELSDVKSRLDAIESAKQKAGLAAGGSRDSAIAEHKSAFANFVRKGAEDGLRDLEKKALNISAPDDGGFAVPEMIDSMIHDLLVEISPMRAYANVIQTGTSDYKKLVNVRGSASGWVGETDARGETATPKLAEVKPFFGELYASPKATVQSMEDMFFNVEQWLGSELATEFARAEGLAFVSGDGVNKPKGFLAYANNTDVDGVRAFGTLQAIESGVVGDLGGYDALIDLVHSLKAGHRNGAAFAMTKETLAVIRKLKTVDGHYLWQPSLQAGTPGQLLGYNVVEMEDMPNVAGGSIPVAFGNWAAGYTIVDRVGTSVLRDPYSTKGYVEFYTRKRVGGMVVDSEAIKLLKVSAA